MHVTTRPTICHGLQGTCKKKKTNKQKLILHGIYGYQGSDHDNYRQTNI